MTQDDVIRLAREANFYHSEYADSYAASLQEIEAFAKLVAATEREACACECEKDAFVEQWKGLAEATKRIRARGNA